MEVLIWQTAFNWPVVKIRTVLFITIIQTNATPVETDTLKITTDCAKC